MDRYKENLEDDWDDLRESVESAEPEREITLREHLSNIASLGGSSRSRKKIAAARRNAVAAFRARFPERPLPPKLQRYADEG